MDPGCHVGVGPSLSLGPFFSRGWKWRTEERGCPVRVGVGVEVEDRAEGLFGPGGGGPGDGPTRRHLVRRGHWGCGGGTETSRQESLETLRPGKGSE